MKEILLTYGKETLGLVNEMSPYLLLGFLFAGLLRVLIPSEQIQRFLGENNFRSVLNASLLGIPLPLCSCGVIPAGIGFYRNGASRGASVSFLVSTPQTGVDSILATYSLLGFPMAIIRPIVALVSGIFGGSLTNLATRKELRLALHAQARAKDHPRTIRELFRYGFVELIQEISKWLVIGILLAGLLAVLIPADFFTSTISNEYLALLLMVLASVPLYICATGSIPIAAVLMMKGLAPGAALVLLMAGPATNIATMSVIGQSLGKKSLWTYLVSIIGAALFFGVLVNELIPRDWIISAMPAMGELSLHEHGAAWWQWLASALLFILILNGFLARWYSRRNQGIADQKKMNEMKGQLISYRVEGMTCNHCKSKVEEGLGSLPGVDRVLADQQRDLVLINASELSDNQIREKVESLGYKYRGRA